jgi:hypothetical protein
VVVMVIGTPATGRRPESTSWPRIVTGRPNLTRTRPPLRTLARSRCDVTLVTRKRAGAPVSSLPAWSRTVTTTSTLRGLPRSSGARSLPRRYVVASGR